jgi:cell division protein FtsB
MNREMLTTTTDFFAWRFADLAADERIEIRSFPSGGGAPRQSWHRTPDEAARAVLALPQDHHAFYGVNARRDRGGKKEDVTKIRGLWADQDFKHYRDGRAGADAALAAFPLPPTAVIESGNGYHLYWQFAAPIEATGDVEALLGRLYAALGGLDSVQDASRVFRIPGTLNHKSDPPRRATITVPDSGVRYTFGDFLAILPAPEPAPARPSWTPPTGGARAANRDEPTRDDIREWLRCIAPVGDYKDHWLKVLAAVHSVYPGADGVALAEEWSPGKAGEVAEKFASFKRAAGGAGAVGVGTLIYLAQAGGWQPARSTRSSMPPGDGADLAAEVTRLRADIARLGDQLRREQEEGALLVARVTELETENAALEAGIKHPDQAAGVGAFDLIEAAERARKKGDTLTRDGKDYARVPFKEAVNRRSQTTLARGFKSIQEAGKLDAFTRTEHIETPTYKGPVPIAYIHIPTALHGRRGAAVLAVLPEATAKKHGGRRTIEVPAEVAAQPHPVKRQRELVTRWYDALSDEKIVTEAPTLLGSDYWTAQGEQRTTAEIEALRVRAGYQPAPAKPWQPTQAPLRIHPDPEPFQDETVSPRAGTSPDPEPFQDETVSDQHPEPFQLDAIDYVVKGRQVETVSPPVGEPFQDETVSPDREPFQDETVFAPPLVEDVPGQCADIDCDRRAAIGGYCEPHYGEYSQRYAGAYDFAADDD